MPALNRYSGADITVGGMIGERLDLTWRGNLLALNWEEDFLAPFRKQELEGGYVGLGKTLEGLTRMAANCRDPQLLALRQHVIDNVIEAQGADGYLGIYRPASRTVMLWDVHEQAYMLLALLADWGCFQDERCLNAAKRLGDYLILQLDQATMTQVGKKESWGEACEPLAFLGLDRALLALSRATGNEAYQRFVVDQMKLPAWNLPIVEGRHVPFEGHMYAYLTRCLAQLELYELTGDKALLSQTHRVLDYLRQQQALVITGTNSIEECWHSDQQGTGNLGETCATAYLIRLLAKLLCLEGDGFYGDWMERSIYNALFAAQSPDGRQLRYYVPFEGERVYWPKDTYCCPGNYRRIIGELPELIAFQQGNEITVNLYTQAVIRTEGLTLRIDTDYPRSGKIKLSLELSEPVELTIRLRHPGWCERFEPTVNGAPVPLNGPSNYPSLNRLWSDGDTIQLDLPMPWQFVEGFRQQAGKVAIMRGPLVYCLAPEHQARPMDISELELFPDTLDLLDNGNGRIQAHDGDTVMDLTLHPFPVPECQATYFSIPTCTTSQDPLFQDL